MGVGGVSLSEMLGGLLVIGIALVVYFLPMIIAIYREHRNAGALAALNLVLGWTLLGWVGALVWSLWARREPVDQGSQ
jgi:hypothetical protein